LGFGVFAVTIRKDSRHRIRSARDQPISDSGPTDRGAYSTGADAPANDRRAAWAGARIHLVRLLIFPG
jgi:hypothetical protein